MPVLLALQPVLDFTKKHWRVSLAVGLVVAAFLYGRFSRKPPMQIVTVTQWKERVVTQTVEKKAETKTRTVVVYRDRIRKPDGTVETKEEVHEADGSKETDATATKSANTKTEAQKVTVTPVAPKWHVAAGIGMPIDLRSPLSPTSFFLVDVSRQIIGPFSIGVWGTLDVNGKNPTLGLSAGVSF